MNVIVKCESIKKYFKVIDFPQKGGWELHGEKEPSAASRFITRDSFQMKNTRAMPSKGHRPNSDPQWYTEINSWYITRYPCSQAIG